MHKALILGGATGLLGQALVVELRNSATWEVTTLGREDGNLFDRDFLAKTLQRIKPDCIFNTVAYTQVDDAEDHPEGAMEVNGHFPALLCELLSDTKTHLIHISTDFVFNGQKKTPYTEEDTPCPESVYGRTKLAGEEAIISLLPQQSAILRTAWLFGPFRKNFVQTILNVAQTRDSINVVADQVGSPTSTSTLAHMCRKIAEERQDGLWHTVNSGSASWYELAKRAIQGAGIACHVNAIPSEAWPQKAKRPPYSVLCCEKYEHFFNEPICPWQDALESYLKEANLCK